MNINPAIYKRYQLNKLKVKTQITSDFISSKGIECWLHKVVQVMRLSKNLHLQQSNHDHVTSEQAKRNKRHCERLYLFISKTNPGYCSPWDLHYITYYTTQLRKSTFSIAYSAIHPLINKTHESTKPTT